MVKQPQDYYIYNPLPEGSIRLAKIHPTPKNQRVAGKYQYERQVEIDLEVFTISQCPAYTALSYTWGPSGSLTDPTPCVFTQVERVFPILCNGCILLGTWNLRSALLQLRHAINETLDVTDEEDEHAKVRRRLHLDVRYIWIDALCINQQDLQERSHQVRLMSEIYRKAVRTFVWLGRKDKFSDTAIESLTKVREAISWAMDETRRTGKDTPVPPVNLELPERDACAVLFSRNWFSRYWILQEVILSREVVVLLGDRVTSFIVYERARTLVQLANFRVVGEIQDIEGVDLSYAIHTAHGTIRNLNFIEAARDRVSKGQLSDFMSLMTYIRAQQCHDPRDRIYSLLGICIEFCPNGKIVFEPDYTKSVSQVYIEATEFIVRARKDLCLLNLLHQKDRIEGLPSWCPDYSNLTAAIYGSHQQQFYQYEHLPEEVYHINGHRLKVYGQCIGRVSEIVRVFDMSHDHITSSKPWLSTGLGPICSMLIKINSSSTPESLNMQNFSRTELLWRTFMTRFQSCFSQLADWWEDELPSGAALLLPQFLRSFLYGHVIRKESSIKSKGKNVDRSTYRKDLKKYAEALESALAKLAALEPSHAVFLPRKGEMTDICVKHGDEQTAYMAAAMIPQAGAQELMSMRSNAKRLHLDLPDSFTQPPKIKMNTPSVAADFDWAASWHLGFANSMSTVPTTARAFRTTTELFGMTACEMRNDDEIWILEGALAPVCLRRLDHGSYQVLGEVYMYGVMDKGNVRFCRNPRVITLE